MRVVSVGVWTSFLLSNFDGAAEGPAYLRDLMTFAEYVLGFPLEDKQRELLANAGRRVILNCARQWGKSVLTAVVMLWVALTQPGSEILVVAPSIRQSLELVVKARRLLRRLGVAAKGDGANRGALRFANGSRIIPLPANEATIRGFSGVRMLVIDEAAMLDDAVYEAVRPMVAQSEGMLWLLSTPRGAAGFFHREWLYGREWRRVEARATECPRYTAEILHRERESLGERKFAQEFLCEFVELEDSLFAEGWLERCVNPAVEAWKL